MLNAGIIWHYFWFHALLDYLWWDLHGHPVSINFPFFSRLKIEELEAERSKLAEENRSLEMKLEKLTLQVGCGGPEQLESLAWSVCCGCSNRCAWVLPAQFPSSPSGQGTSGQPVLAALSHLYSWPCHQRGLMSDVITQVHLSCWMTLSRTSLLGALKIGPC